MKPQTVDLLRTRVSWVHEALVRGGEAAEDALITHAFSQVAPPLGWHIWHMARFADRVQSKLAVVTHGTLHPQIWHRDGLAQAWHLRPEQLGVFETGMCQAPEHAQLTVSTAGRERILAYAGAAFEACNAVVGQLAEGDLETLYDGQLDYEQSGDRDTPAGTRESTVAQDLIEHISHGSRHVGMMEALRGLSDSPGTLSI